MLNEIKALRGQLAALPADDPQRPALQARYDRLMGEMDRAAMARVGYVGKPTRAAQWRRQDSSRWRGDGEAS